MNNSILMKIFDHTRHFIHHSSSLSLGEKLLPEDFVQQFSPSHQLEDQENLVLLLEHVAQADYAGVLAISEQDLNFLLTVSALSVDNLDGVLHLSGPVDTPVTKTVAAPPDLLAELVFLLEHPGLVNLPGGLDGEARGDPWRRLLSLAVGEQRSHIAEASEELVSGGTGRDGGTVLRSPRGVLGVEVESVIRHHRWLERRGQLLLHQQRPVNGGKEGMSLDVIDTVRPRAKSVGWISFEESSQERLGFCTGKLRHPQLGLEDLVHRLLPVLSLERKATCQHLVHQDAETPPIRGEVVAAPVDNLGSHVLNGTWEKIFVSTLENLIWNLPQKL